MAVVISKKYLGESAQIAVELTVKLDTPVTLTVKDVTTDANGTDFRFVDSNPLTYKAYLIEQVKAFNAACTADAIVGTAINGTDLGFA